MLYDQVYTWGKPDLLNLHIGFKWLLFSFNLDFELLSFSLSELLKIGSNDHMLLHARPWASAVLTLNGRGKWDAPGFQMKELSSER